MTFLEFEWLSTDYSKQNGGFDLDWIKKIEALVRKKDLSRGNKA